MSPEDIRALVLSNEDFKKLAVSGCDGQLAAELTIAQPAIAKPGTYLGELGILSLLGTVAGETFLQGLEYVAGSDSPMAPVLARIVRWMRSPQGVDVGHAITQQNLLALAEGGAISAESAAAVIAHGSHRPAITVDQVSAALTIYRPEGKVGSPIEG